MSALLPTPTTSDIDALIVELGSAKYQIVYTWRERLGGWYFDLFDLEGNALATGRRIEPDSGPLWGLVRNPGELPDVIITAIGPSPYVQGDLGVNLFLVLTTFDELEADVGELSQPTVIAS